MSFFDMHTHTFFSFDGRQTTMTLCRDAADHGLLGVTVTDHYDFFASGVHNYYDYFYKERRARIGQMRHIWAGALKVRYGIELGQPQCDMAGYRRVMAREDFDAVIGSIHNLNDGTSIYDKEYRDQSDCAAVLEEYFSMMREMVESCDIDILGHIDYPLRVMDGAFEGRTDLSDMKQLIIPILMVCAEKGIAIEINTAGMRKWLGVPGPAPWVLREYKRLGGKYISFGSDSHRGGDCAYGFAEAAALAREGGFDSAVWFDGRRPVAVSL